MTSTTPPTRAPSLVLLVLTVLAASFDAAYASLPQVDFNRMGKVGLAGAFAGLDVFNNASVAYDPASATLLARATNGSLTRVGATNDGGSISAGCDLGGVFYVAGSFSSIGGTTASNVASYAPSSGAFSALGSGGPNGPVSALYCDASQNHVWVGGKFSSPAGAVALWDVKGGAWSSVPFKGLDGAQAEVLSITTNASAQSLFFSGSFVTTFLGNTSVVTINGTNNPAVPFSPGATPYSSALVPVPLQGAEIEGSPSSNQQGFSDIQNILCPSGADGAGNTWFTADGNTGVITARAFAFISASGVRLGNTFLDGRGTTGFTVTTIPDNTVQTLRYLDPHTGQNATCTNDCPLLTDSSILYQDFVFAEPLNITGVQVTLSSWQGAGPGLHLFQLLSSGAFASAVDNQNSISCFAPNPSNTTRTGSWTEKDANTGLPGTVQEVLVATVPVGTSPGDGPSFTWMPYVSGSGAYDVHMLVPGCANFQDCALRTSVRVVVFPGGGQDPWVTTVDQRNQQDASTLLYSGTIVPSSNNFVVTVEMTLADSPVGTGQNGQYEMVADRVQLVLNSATNSTSTPGSSGGGSTGNSTTTTKSGFGFFEWPISSSATADATSTLSNTSVTALDTIGFDFFNSLGGADGFSTSSPPAIAAVAHHSSGTIFLAGNFTLTSGTASGATNIVAFKNGALAALANNGLNGPVSSLALSGDSLYVGGAFTSTTSSTGASALRGVAVYDVQQGAWSPLVGGVDGAVASVAVAGGQVQVAGNFTTLLTAPGSASGTSAGGFATWDITNGTWVNSGGYLVGSMTFVSNTTSPSSSNKNETQFVAGNVAASLRFGASGFVMLSNGGNDGVPLVTPLGAQLASGTNVNATNSTSSTGHRRRSHAVRHAAGKWLSTTVLPRIFSRQTLATPLSPLPTAAAAVSAGPTVLAGAFWTNTSSSHEVVIIGGNFTGATGAQNVAIYDPTSGALSVLHGAQPTGAVHALLVQGSTLYVGGQFALSDGSSGSGFAVYDLVKQAWTSGLVALAGDGGAAVVVRSITASESASGAVIVAGSFGGAGSQTCRAICELDAESQQWSALGSGIQGEVVSVAYAGSKQEILIASGSIALSDGTQANVAQYSFANKTWSAVGDGSDLPGPVTAVEVNNGNASSIFAAGRSSDGSSPFLSVWNGVSWSSLGSSLASSTNVSQLVMVPLVHSHSANSVIESDRMLLVSGSLSDSSFGNASSALFDGQNFIPYIVSTSASGIPGTISALIHSYTSFSFSVHHYLATGIVILISIAIAAGIVFLLVLIGILWALFSRRDDSGDKFDPADTEEDDDSTHHRPSSLLAHINAATRTTILGGQSPFAPHSPEKEAELAAAEVAGAGAASTTAHGHEDGAYDPRAETPSDGAGGMIGDDAGRPARARYSFDGAEEGELPLSAGLEVVVLDDRDPAWWYAMDPRTGREGVVPANYVY